MGLVSAFPGLRERSPKRLVLDAGQAWKNLNLTALDATGIEDATTTPFMFEGEEYTPQSLGATRGGITLRPNKEEVDIEVNGIRVPIRGFQRVNAYRPEIELTLLETTDIDTLAMALGQSDVTSTASGYKKVRPRIDIKSTDYIPNICLLCSTTEDDQEKPAIFVLENVKVMEATEFPFEDPGELALTVTLKGHALPTQMFIVPCVLYLPDHEDGLDDPTS